MAIPYAKILTRFTLSAAQTLRFYISDLASFDTAVDCTIAAGDYYVSWDNQSDDYLYAIMSSAYTQFVAAAVTGYSSTSAAGKPQFTISEGKVVILATNSKEIRVAWTEQDGAAIAAILGFDSSADLDLDSSASYTATADWKHAYGFYCTEDGQLYDHLHEDIESVNALQSKAVSAQVKTQFLASSYENTLHLSHLSRALTFSGDQAYKSTPVHPYEKNEPLQCWWAEARQGIEFRIYTRWRTDSGLAEYHGSAASGTVGPPSTITDSGKAYDTDPQELASKLLIADDTLVSARFLIASHTATVITLTNSLFNNDFGGSSYRVYDHPYRTYVVDLSKMRSFAPRQIGTLDEFEIQIPLLRYET